MDNPETESQPTPDEEQSASNERAERKARKIVAVGFFLLVILLWLAVRCLNKALAAGSDAEAGHPRFKVVEITSGSALSDIAGRLASENVISSELLFKVAAIGRRSTRELKAGEYRFDTSMSLLDVLSRLEQGRVMLHEFTVPEGYTVRQIARRLDEYALADAEQFVQLAADAEYCKELGVDGPSFEGFLFPDTYKIAKGLSARDVLHIMVDRFWSAWSEETRRETAGGGSTLREIVTIASIVEKEALFDDEMPLIAGVIYNRLEKNIPLQCDVTIRYPLDNYGTHLTYADLKMDSPYNSYLYPGIPPTPICSPGHSALRAALNPAETDYLFFVAMNNGRHKFSSSLEEHNRAVHKYQILNERG